MNAMLFQFADRSAYSGFGDDEDEIEVVGFAGMGGSCTGIEAATGEPVTIAMNHSVGAVSVHRVNHPYTEHFCQNIWQVNPKDAARGRKVGLAWFSPDCRHFSKAKGAKPVERNIRDLAWVVVNWAQQVRPRIIMLENVEEFRQWCPVDEHGRPVTSREKPHQETLFTPPADAPTAPKAMHGKKAPNGETFEAWCAALRKLGYVIEWRELRSYAYGLTLQAATIRKRLYIILRCDGEPIVWPDVKYDHPESEDVKSGKLQPYKTAADCIDWSIDCPSIFERKRPLKEATCRRIAAGIMRYVVNSPKPFIIPLTHHGSPSRGYSVDVSLPTITAAHGGELALIVPHLMTMRNAQKPYQGAGEPAHTFTAGGAHQYLVTAFLAQHNTGVIGRPADAPVSTILQSGSHQNLVTSHLVKLRGTCADGQMVDQPMPTLMAGGTHVGEVRAFLVKYYGNEQDGHEIDKPIGTLTTADRFGLVTVTIAGEEYVIVDIGMRMLTPREMARAQGFPETTIIAPVCDYETETGAIRHGPLPIRNQVKLIGNVVTPNMSEDLVASNYVRRRGAAVLEAAE